MTSLKDKECKVNDKLILFTDDVFQSKDVKEAVLEFEKELKERLIDYERHLVYKMFKQIFGEFEENDR